MPRITKRKRKELARLVEALTDNQRAWLDRQNRRGIEHLSVAELDEAIEECHRMLARNVTEMLEPEKPRRFNGTIRTMPLRRTP